MSDKWLTLAVYAGLWLFSLFFTANFVKLHLLRREMSRYSLTLDPVPTSVGISMVLTFLIYQLGFLLLKGDWMYWQWSLREPGFAVLIVSFLGLYDDMFRRHEKTSFKTHLSMLTGDGVLSSGVLSVLGIFLVSALIRYRLDISPPLSGLPTLLLNVFLITLSCTFLGLINTRPLRTLKTGLGSIWLIFLGSLYLERFHPQLGSVHHITWKFTLPVVFIAMGYWHYERSGKAMLGSVGTNFLGFAFGLFLVNELSFELKVAALILLAVIHILAIFIDIGRMVDRLFGYAWVEKFRNRKKGVVLEEDYADPSSPND